MTRPLLPESARTSTEMPQPKLCSFGGCPCYSIDGRSYCGNHLRSAQQAAYQTKRANPLEARRQAIYQDPRWRSARAVVLHRDGYECQSCSATTDLVVDHIFGLFNSADPFDPSELQTLCRSCSGKKDGQRSHD